MNKIGIILIFCSFFVGCASSTNVRKQVVFHNAKKGIFKPRTPSYMEIQVVDNEGISEDKSPVEKNAETSFAISEKPSKKEKITIENVSKNTKLVIDTAYSYLGTPYKYGGTTRNGMDCSGFMIACYEVVDIQLNRSSDGMALQGEAIDISEVRIGDLLFFKTSRKREISHVGMVVEVGNTIKFIHASTSRGVIVSDLSETYWNKAFVKAKRIL